MKLRLSLLFIVALIRLTSSQVQQNAPSLSVIFTFSPRNSKLHFHYFFRTFGSLLRYIPGLKNANFVLAFDGTQVKSPISTLFWKCRETFHSGESYKHFKEMTIKRIESRVRNVTVIEQDERLCLTGNLKRAMDHTNSEFVLVLQDDMQLIRSLDIDSILQGMLQHNISYLTADMNGLGMHEHFFTKGKGNLCNVSTPELDALARCTETAKTCVGKTPKKKITVSADGLGAVSASGFSDGTHIARRDWYYRNIWPAVLANNRSTAMEEISAIKCLSDEDEGMFVLDAKVIHHIDYRLLET
jgi:hypothetical protein